MDGFTGSRFSQPCSAAPVPGEPPAHPKLLALLDLWTAKAAGRSMPLRSDLSPFELKTWLGHLTLVDVIDGGRDFLYRVHGTDLVLLAAVEMTGKRISQGQAAFWQTILVEYRAALLLGKPCRIARMSRPGQLHNGWEKLILPLSRTGQGIECFLSGMYRPLSG